MIKGFVVFLLAFYSVLPALSRPEPLTSDALKIVRAMDRDDDLRISKAESCGRLCEEFERWDRNEDGFLNEREVAVYIKKLDLFVPCHYPPCLPSFE